MGRKRSIESSEGGDGNNRVAQGSRRSSWSGSWSGSGSSNSSNSSGGGSRSDSPVRRKVDLLNPIRLSSDAADITTSINYLGYMIDKVMHGFKDLDPVEAKELHRLMEQFNRLPSHLSLVETRSTEKASLPE